MPGRVEEALRYSDATRLVFDRGPGPAPFGAEGWMGTAYLASGQRAQPGDTNVILEAFKPGTEPNGDNNQVLMGVGASASGAGDAPTPASDSSGGLY